MNRSEHQTNTVAELLQRVDRKCLEAFILEHVPMNIILDTFGPSAPSDDDGTIHADNDIVDDHITHSSSSSHLQMDTNNEDGIEEKVKIEPITPLLAKASAEEGKKIAGRCSQCHSFDKSDPHKLGPNLHAVVGSISGARSGYTYSEAMTTKKVTWDAETLNVYLYDPKAFLPGTKMAFAGLKNDAERTDLIAYLLTLK